LAYFGKEITVILTGDIANLVAQQVELLDTLKLSEQSRYLSAIDARAADETFRILFVGEYSRGKSTLINALIGQSFFAKSVLPVPTQNVVRYGASPQAWSQQGSELVAVAMEALPDNNAERVEVELPVDWLRDRIEIVEQPSVSEQPEAFETAMMAADLVVVVLASDALYSATESRIVAQLKAAGHRDLWFACNFYDRISPGEQEQVRQAARVRLPVNPDRIFFVSAEQALEGKADEAGLTALRDGLLQMVDQNKTAIKRDRVKQFLHQSLTTAEETMTQQQSATVQSQADTAKKRRDLQLAYEAIAKASRRLEGEIEDYRQRTSDVLQTMTRTFVLDLAPQMMEWLSQHKGPDPICSAKLKIDDITQQWRSTELEPYWHRQMEQQSKTLRHGLQTFTQKLNHFYEMTGSPNVSIIPPANDGAFSVGRLGVVLPDELPMENNRSSGLIGKASVLVPLTAVAITMFIIQPVKNSFPIGMAGLFVAVMMGKSQFSPTNQTARARAIQDYGRAIQRQADSVSFEVSGEINTRFQNLQDDLHRLLSTNLDDARRQLNEELAGLSEQGGYLISAQGQLDSIKRELAERGV
jgi:hypothetical protein